MTFSHSCLSLCISVLLWFAPGGSGGDLHASPQGTDLEADGCVEACRAADSTAEMAAVAPGELALLGLALLGLGLLLRRDRGRITPTVGQVLRSARPRRNNDDRRRGHRRNGDRRLQGCPDY